MALSGSFETKYYYTSGGDEVRLVFSWTATQSIAKNESYIDWELRLRKEYTQGGIYCGGFKVKIDGETVYAVSTDDRRNLYNNDLIASGKKTIKHNADGKRTFTAYAEAGIYYYAINSTGSKTFTLDSIPREATIVSAPNFTDEDKPVIKYSNPAGNTVQKLQICITTTGSNAIVSYRNVPKTGSTYTFNFTTAEKEALQKACLNSQSMSVGFYLNTVIDGVDYYSKMWKTLTIKNANPTINPTVVDVNQITIDLTGNSSTIVRGHSTAKYTFNASAKKFATVKTYELSNGSQTAKNASGQITNANSNVFDFVVRDSRGNTATQRITKGLVDYIKPTCDITAKPVFAGETAINIDVNASGKLFTGSFGKVNNSNDLYYRYKTNSTEYGTWQLANGALTLGAQDYNTTFSIPGLNYQETYTIQVKIKDKLNEVLSKEYAVSAVPVFDWSRDDFNFNVPVKFSKGFTGLADYVEAEGISGEWYVRKWHSGYAECWARKSFSLTLSQTPVWGDMFGAGLDGSAINLPFTFKEMPNFYTSITTNAGNYWLTTQSEVSQGSVSKTPAYQIVRPTKYTKTAKPILNYYVVGKWR